MFEMPLPGLFLVRYDRAGDMLPELQGELAEAIRVASRVRPIAIVFFLGDEIGSVDFAVPRFWIKMIDDPAIQIGAMGMVTRSLAVEIAAKSFGAASRFRRHPVEIRTFTDEREATSWAKHFLLAPLSLHP